MADQEKFTDDELNDLTDEEREALLSDDDVVDDGKPNTNDDEGDDEGDDNTEGDDDAAQKAEGSDDEGNDDAPGRDDGAGNEPPRADDTPPARQREYSPQLRGELPEDFDDQMKKLAADRAELRKKYNEGDIDFDEYESQRDALDDQRKSLEQQQFKASIAQEMREDRWLNRDVAQFMAEHTEYKPGSALYAMLDSEVRMLQAKAQNEGKDPLDPAILDAAHNSIRQTLAKDLGLNAPAGKKPGVPRQRGDIPPTLAGLPASEPENTDGGKWAALDRLADKDPVAFEERLEAMSEAERDAYLDAR